MGTRGPSRGRRRWLFAVVALLGLWIAGTRILAGRNAASPDADLLPSAPGDAAPTPEASRGSGLAALAWDAATGLSPDEARWAVVGRVLQEDGKTPAPNTTVTLITMDPDAPRLWARTASDAKGEFRLRLSRVPSDLNPSAVHLVACDPSSGRASWCPSLASLETREDGVRCAELRLRATGKVEGTVVDEEGKPVSDASVLASLIRGDGTYSTETIAVGEGGTFRIDHVGGFCTVEPRAPSRVGESRAFWLEEGSVSSHRFVLKKAPVTLHLQCVDRDQSPVVGVRLSVQGRHEGGDRALVTTDARGQALLRGFPRQGVTIGLAGDEDRWVFDVPIAPVESIQPQNALETGRDCEADSEGFWPVHLLMRRAGTVSGKLTRASGEPAAGLTVGLDRCDSVVTDADGAYRFDVPLLPGRHRITASFGQAKDVDIVEGRNVVDFRVSDAFRLRARLIRKDTRRALFDGAPLLGARQDLNVWVAGKAEDLGYVVLDRASCVWEGWIACGSAPYVVTLGRGEELLSRVEMQGSPVGGALVDLDLPVDPTRFGALRLGFLRASDGKRPPFVSLQLQRPGRGTIYAFVWQQEKALIAFLEPGSFLVEASHESGRGTALVEVVGGKETDGGEIRLEKPVPAAK